jgi:hypothetical protein
MIPYILTHQGTINAVYDGRSYSFAKDSRFYEKIKKALNEQSVEDFLHYSDIARSINETGGGKITYEGGVLRYNGSIIKNSMAERIIRMIEDGFNADPLIKFFEFCYENPNPTVVDRLYDFLANNCIMIDNNGLIVGYKKVREDGYDYYSGTVKYELNQVVTIERDKCDSSSANTCSSGLHIGSLDYVTRQWYPGQGKIFLLRTNPRDVTAIPEEAGAPKLRSCRVEVIAEYKGEAMPSVYQPESKITFIDGPEPGDEDYEGRNCGDDDDGCDDPYNEAEECDCEECRPSNKPLRDSRGRFVSQKPIIKGPARDSRGRFTKA